MAVSVGSCLAGELIIVAPSWPAGARPPPVCRPVGEEASPDHGDAAMPPHPAAEIARIVRCAVTRPARTLQRNIDASWRPTCRSPFAGPGAPDAIAGGSSRVCVTTVGGSPAGACFRRRRCEPGAACCAVASAARAAASSPGLDWSTCSMTWGAGASTATFRPPERTHVRSLVSSTAHTWRSRPRCSAPSRGTRRASCSRTSTWWRSSWCCRARCSGRTAARRRSTGSCAPPSSGHGRSPCRSSPPTQSPHRAWPASG
jgi:hypothetical protein